MDESLFERPQRLALAPEILAQRLAEIQAQPNGIEAAMDFLQAQAELQERDRIAESSWRTQNPQAPSAEQAVAELEEHWHAETRSQTSVAAEHETLQTATESAHSLEPDFEPVTASNAMAASGSIPMVLRRPNILRDLSWFTFVLAACFLASLAGSSLLGDVGNSPAALLPLVSVFAPLNVAVAGVLGLGLYLGARFQTSFGDLLSMTFGVVAAWLIRTLGVAALVLLAWMVSGQLGYTLTGAAGELFQGSSVIVDFAQSGHLSAIALASFALLALLARLAPKNFRTAIRALSAILLIALLVAATANDGSSLGALIGPTGYIAASPSSVATYAMVFLTLGFAAAFEFGSKIPAPASRAPGIAVIAVTLAILPTVVVALLALVNPISTPKLLSMLDLAFIPVGCIALLAIVFKSIRSLAGSGRQAGALVIAASLALVALPLVVNSQTDGSQQLFDAANVILAVLIAQSLGDLLQRRSGTHLPSLQNRRGIYGSANLLGLTGFLVATTLGLSLLNNVGSLPSTAIGFGIAGLWQVTAARVLVRRQDRELGGRNSRVQSMFDEVKL